jgi:hypothetical protein
MSAHETAIVTAEHLQRAYAQLRRPDWPDLDEMNRVAKQMAIVRARACALAHGQALPNEPVARHAPATLAASSRPLCPTERRRRDDHFPAIDLKSRAAGERDDD